MTKNIQKTKELKMTSKKEALKQVDLFHKRFKDFMKYADERFAVAIIRLLFSENKHLRPVLGNNDKSIS